MIPTNTYTLENVNIVSENTKSYKMNIKDNIITGFIDEKDALIQAIYKILNTERNTYPMYSRNYGIELGDLIGLPMHYVISQVEDRITDALLYDDRIVSINNFYFEKNKSKLFISFTVLSIYGEIDSSLEINL